MSLPGIFFNMGRVPRIHIEGALYYITSRGDHNEDIFKDSQDYYAYLNLIKKYKELHRFKLFSFVLLPNHLHLLLELSEKSSLSQIMHDINSSYTKYFNKRHKRKGHLFQERYKSILIEKNPYLPLLTVYVHLNPKRVGIVSELKEYIFSSYLAYLKNDTSYLGLNLKKELIEVFDFLKNKGYEDYLSFLKSLDEKEMNSLAQVIHKRKFIGSQDFLKKIEIHIRKYKSENKIKKERFLKKTFLAASLISIILIGVAFHLYNINSQLKKEFKNILDEKEKGFQRRMEAEKERIRRGLEEKYAADKVSYKAIIKRIELEKRRIKEKQEKLKNSKKNES